MSDVVIRQSHRAGRITLSRPDALNAVTHEMCLAIEAALDAWRSDASVKHVVLDAVGHRAFCAGGDIAELYEKGRAGNFAFGQAFWADEYRLNAKIFRYPKPIVAFMQGFTMGGGVGLGCHGSHRIVGEHSLIAMPECGIGLMPDVGGSYILARAPGHLGAYLGMTGARMAAADAIYAGFADFFIPEDGWPDLIAALEADLPADQLAKHARHPGLSELEDESAWIDRVFGVRGFQDIQTALKDEEHPLATPTRKLLSRNAPLSMAATQETLHRLRRTDIGIETALEMEYRFTFRAQQHGDLLEGIRAAIIDKDKAPRWQYADGDVPAEAVETMLAPLGADSLQLEDTT